MATVLEKLRDRLTTSLQSQFGSKFLKLDPYPPAITDAATQQVVEGADGLEWMVTWDGTQTDVDMAKAQAIVQGSDAVSTPEEEAAESPAVISSSTHGALLVAVNKLILGETVPVNAAAEVAAAASQAQIASGRALSYVVSGAAANPVILEQQQGAPRFIGPGTATGDLNANVLRRGLANEELNVVALAHGFHNTPANAEISLQIRFEFANTGQQLPAVVILSRGASAPNCVIGGNVNGDAGFLLRGRRDDVLMNLFIRVPKGSLPIQRTIRIIYNATINVPGVGIHSNRQIATFMFGPLPGDRTPWRSPTSAITTSTPDGDHDWSGNDNDILRSDDRSMFVVGDRNCMDPRIGVRTPLAEVKSYWLRFCFLFRASDFGLINGDPASRATIQGIEFSILRRAAGPGVPGAVLDEWVKVGHDDGGTEMIGTSGVGGTVWPAAWSWQTWGAPPAVGGSGNYLWLDPAAPPAPAPFWDWIKCQTMYGYLQVKLVTPTATAGMVQAIVDTARMRIWFRRN